MLTTASQRLAAFSKQDNIAQSKDRITEEAVVKRALLVAFGAFVMLVPASPGEADTGSRLERLTLSCGVNGNDTYQIGPTGQLDTKKARSDDDVRCQYGDRREQCWSER
jgi:hypothetical protein